MLILGFLGLLGSWFGWFGEAWDVNSKFGQDDVCDIFAWHFCIAVFLDCSFFALLWLGRKAL